MTTTSVTVPNIPKPAFLKLVAPTQISINAKNAFLELSPQQSAQIQKDKDATTKWIKELFELPDAALIPGRNSTTDCPIARALRAAGLQGLRVMRTRLRYENPSSGRTVRVMFPAKIRRFVRYFDAGLIPELMVGRE